MTWDHRVLAHEHKGELTFEIHEVFYNDDGVPNMCTENAVGVASDTLPGLSHTLRLMLAALMEPILNYADFGPGGKYYKKTGWGVDYA